MPQSPGTGRAPAGAQRSICEYAGGGEVTFDQPHSNVTLDRHNTRSYLLTTQGHIGLTSEDTLGRTKPHWVPSEVTLDPQLVEAPRKHVGLGHIGPVTLDHGSHSTRGHIRPPSGHIGPVTRPHWTPQSHIGQEVRSYWTRRQWRPHTTRWGHWYPESTREKAEGGGGEGERGGGGGRGMRAPLFLLKQFVIETSRSLLSHLTF